MSEFLEELLNQHLFLLTKLEKDKSQHFFELKELGITLKNRKKQKQTSLKLQVHELQSQITLQQKEIEQKNQIISELRKTFDENLKVFFLISH